MSDMPTLRVEVRARPGRGDGRGRAVLAAAQELGIAGLRGVEIVDLFWLGGDALQPDDAVLDLLHDPVLQQAEVHASGAGTRSGTYVEVARRPGVTDAQAESLLLIAEKLGLRALRHAATGHRYELDVDADADAASLAARLAEGLLANVVVDRFATCAPLAAAFLEPLPTPEATQQVPVRGCDDDALLAVSAERRLSLDLREMQAVARHFETLGRDPTDLELEMIAQTWSEHCVHKTFKAKVQQRELDAAGEVLFEAEIDSIFKTWIVAATAKAARPERLRSVFVDNAGIVAFDDDYDLALKVETHNHPSALEPFGGANTGVGGVVRDILGVSARPIANLDVLCFGPPDLPASALPAGVLPPRRIAAGVIDGIEDYGNKMGIPTVAGAITYDAGYVANPLVFCGTLGILPTGSHRNRANPGDRVVVLGGRTGRDGLRGATFSSMSMGQETAAIASTSVQIGHPIHEKAAMEVVLQARDAGLYTAITDCGAGGLSSAVGEMAARIGADIDLTTVPLKVQGLAAWEIWLSEAQERMVLAVPDAQWEALVQLAMRHGSEATTIGRFRDDGQLVVRHGEREVARLDGAFLHDGIPQRELVGLWQAPAPEPLPPCPEQLTAGLLRLLASPGIRSKEEILRRYDHEVQGGTRGKPLCGVAADAPADAAVLVPLDRARTADGEEARRGVALGVGLAPRLGLLDPYAMAWAVVDEAIRNVVAAGADPDEVALLDNFCWGSPTLPDRMGALVRCTRGCHDAAVAFGAPYISGKDSLHNEYRDADGVRRAIPGTLLVTAMATVPDVGEACSPEGARAGDRLYVLGVSDDALGGSAWLGLDDQLGDIAPAAVPDALADYRRLHAAIRDGLCAAVHDVSEGGLGVALAELAIAARCGLDADLDRAPGSAPERGDGRLFGERGGRFVIAVRPADVRAFEAAMGSERIGRVGEMRADDRVQMAAAGQGRVATRVRALVDAFRGHVR
ncbi:MAG: phosphoribosylformylglycinamidine synthase [Pseudomonadota bacterium]